MRRQGAGQISVLTLNAPAADHVVPGVDVFEHHGDIGGVVLQISIHQDNDIADRMINTGGNGGGLTKVTAQDDCPEMVRVFGGKLF